MSYIPPSHRRTYLTISVVYILPLFFYIIMYADAGAKEYSFLDRKKRVFEGEGLTLKYTLFPSK